jgi:hypothetical protein
MTPREELIRQLGTLNSYLKELEKKYDVELAAIAAKEADTIINSFRSIFQYRLNDSVYFDLVQNLIVLKSNLKSKELIAQMVPSISDAIDNLAAGID